MENDNSNPLIEDTNDIFINNQELGDDFTVKIGELTKVEFQKYKFNFNKDKRYNVSLSKTINKDFGEILRNDKNPLKYINLNTIKHNIKILIKEDKNPTKEVLLNRDSTIINHFTSENLKKLLKYNEISSSEENKDFPFQKFINYISFTNNLQLTIKSEEKDNTIDDEKYIFLIFENQKKLISAYSYLKFNIYYSKESLENYFSNYIFELIFEFSHLSDSFLYLLENLGIANQSEDEISIDFPIRDKVRLIREAVILNQKRILIESINELKSKENFDGFKKIPIHKFIKKFNCFNPFYLENQKLIVSEKSLNNNNKLKILKPFFYKDETLKENHFKVNEINLFKEIFLDYQESFSNSFININSEKSTKSFDLFLINEIKRKMEQNISKNGFFPIDLVFNDDNMMNLECCKTKKCNKLCNNLAYKFFSNFLSFFNLLFEVNEGFFHKHMTILNYSYNFNDQNLILIFKSKDDNQTKNKIRLFDLFFLEKWSFMVAELALFIIKDKYKFDEKIDFEEVNDVLQIKKFPCKFRKVVNSIFEEFLELYKNSLPDYLNFCKKISKFPLNKYNAIDNICQHFTNSSIDCLLKNQIFTFQAFDKIYDLTAEKIDYTIIPKMDRILEPYLIYIDNIMHDYLNTTIKKEKFLLVKMLDYDNYINQLKDLNRNKVNWSIFMTNSPVDQPKVLLKLIKENQIQDKLFYEFNYLFNCNYYFYYKFLNELHYEILEIIVLKVSLSFLTFDKKYQPPDADKSIFLRHPNRNLQEMKLELIKRKKTVLKILKLMIKLRKYSSIICYLYSDYVRFCSMKIFENFYQSTNKNILIKIGYYLINLKCFNIEKDFCREDYYKINLN